MQIESYQKRLEEFEQTLNQELYLYYSGQKDQLEILPVYSDHSDLFSAESIRAVESELSMTNEGFASRRKSLEKILRFLIDQNLDSHAARMAQEGALFEAQQALLWEGRRITLSQVPACLKKEPDAIQRRKLSERYANALGESGLRQQTFARLRGAAIGLGFRNYAQARERISGTDCKSLLHSFEAVINRLGDRYLEKLRVSFETVLGRTFQEAGSWDVGHWQQKNDPEGVFLERNLVSAIEATVSELGIRPERPDAVQLDLRCSALKHSKPLCIPIRIPREIKIVMLPQEGSGSYAGLLHESGHAYHFAWTNFSLPVEHRIWGDRALCEAYAFLLEHLVQDSQWLAHVLRYAESEEFLHSQSLLRMFHVRRCAGKLCFAMQLHEQESCADMPQIYAETMKAYTGLQHHPESWLEELPDGFDAADYLRGWALEAALKEHLRSKYGKAWFLNRSASGFLKEIWETGQLYRADELCREIGMGSLEPQALADELSEGMR